MHSHCALSSFARSLEGRGGVKHPRRTLSSYPRLHALYDQLLQCPHGDGLGIYQGMVAVLVAEYSYSSERTLDGSLVGVRPIVVKSG